MDERIVKAVEGDHDALGQLLFEYHDRLYRHVQGKLPASLRSLVDPDDILQQTFVEVFRDIGRFQPKSDRAFYRWLATIAEHRLTDTIRAQKSQKRGGEVRQVSNRVPSPEGSLHDLFQQLSASLPTPSSYAQRGEGVQALQVHLAGLPEQYRDAIRLRDLEGLDLDEVADQMGRTKDEVRGLLYRGRKKLRAALGASSLYLSRK